MIEIVPASDLIRSDLPQVTIFRPFDYLPKQALTPLEMLIICGLAIERNPKRIMEIGTADGHTTLNLLLNGNAEVTTVDLPLEIDTEKVPSNYYNRTATNEIGRQLKQTKTNRLIEILHDSITLEWTGLFDLVFIDGCHFLPYVKHDTEQALKHLSDNGLILWHDYGYKGTSVMQYLDNLSARLNLKQIEDTRFVYYEKG